MRVPLRLEQDECAGLKQLFTDGQFSVQAKKSWPIRLLLRSLYMRAREQAGTLPELKFDDDGDVVADNFDSVLDLEDHEQDLPERTMFKLEQVAKQAKFLVDAWARSSLDLYVSLLTRFYCNAFEFQNNECKFVGVGVFPSASMFNHSCAPLCKYAVDKNGFLEVSSLAAIAKGTELTISYLNPAWGLKKRQEHLKKAYFFECACERCRREMTEVERNSHKYPKRRKVQRD
eukprot:TRINITY_DN2724_c0_g1_i2.p1 TRINITY_DN2724_c0_g1~~TRINITY_DN2724_c0_g1_i2.p1  ORF type:complete len:231 (+),score=43.19 TRINITY_DN2724_c0_g1_i2:328-1020(+)